MQVLWIRILHTLHTKSVSKVRSGDRYIPVMYILT